MTRAWPLLLCIVTRAAAEPASAQAEVLFRQGKDLMAAGKIAEACAAFDASQALQPTVSTLLNQANCREKNNQLASAWGLFLDAERQTRSATDATGRQLHATAADRAGKLEHRISTLTVKVASEHASGLEILRDKELVKPGAWNQALPIDGGTYTITARAPDREPWSTAISIATEADPRVVEIPALAPARRQPQPPRPTPPAGAQLTHESGSRVPALLVGGGALVLIGGAIVFEVWSHAPYELAKQESDDQKQRELWQTANKRRYVAEGLALGGAVALAAAVLLYLRADHAEAPVAASRQLRVSPVATGEHLGLEVFGHF